MGSDTDVLADVESGDTAGGSAGRPGTVRLAGRELRVSQLRRSPEAVAALFVQARAEKGHAECLCSPRPLRLVIRCASGGRFHLARWPGERDHHDRRCPFGTVGSGLSGREDYSTAAIVEAESGTRIRLAIPLRQRLSAGEPSSSAAAADAPASARRQRIGLLGLLHWMWEESGLTAWRPGDSASWGRCATLLREQADGCQIGLRDADQVLYVVPAFTREASAANAEVFDAFAAGLGHRDGRIARALILGELKTPTPTRFGYRINLGHLPVPLFATGKLVERLRRSYRPAFSDAPGPGARRIGLLVITRHPRGGYLTVEDAAVMLTSGAYIPADSSFEVVMADYLASAGRAFVKPLRYEGDAVFPDFVLTDTAQTTYVEVFGVRGREEYDRRKAEKQAFYAAEGISVVEWDTVGPLPGLPGPVPDDRR